MPYMALGGTEVHHIADVMTHLFIRLEWPYRKVTQKWNRPPASIIGLGWAPMALLWQEEAGQPAQQLSAIEQECGRLDHTCSTTNH